ncbi:MAG: hypothetical protein R3F31_05335 [Verrucomicrobiales bacterium]
MQIYIATDDGGKQGPLFLHQIETMIRRARCSLPNWAGIATSPIGSRSAKYRPSGNFSNPGSGRRSAKLDKESADGTVITRAQVEDAARGRSVLPTNRRPLARFAARLFDSLLVLSVARHFFDMPLRPRT